MSDRIRKTALLFCLVFLCSAAFAQNEELLGLIDDYYAGVEAQDADAVLATMVEQDDYALTREVIEALITSYSQSGFELEFVSESVSDDGTMANIIFDASGQVTEEESGQTLEISDRFIALFVLEGSGLKISRLMPLVDFTQEIKQYNDIEEAASEQNESEWEAVQDGDWNPIEELVIMAGLLFVLLFIGGVIAVIGKLWKKNKEKEEEKVVEKKPGKAEPKESVKQDKDKIKEKSVKKEVPEKKETATQKARGTEEPKTKKEYSDAVKILRKRFAGGEITKEQFKEMKELLDNP